LPPWPDHVPEDQPDDQFDDNDDDGDDEIDDPVFVQHFCPGANVVINILGQFELFSVNNFSSFLKTNVIKNSAKLALIRKNIASFFSNF
jgi:hypothetical protein